MDKTTILADLQTPVTLSVETFTTIDSTNTAAKRLITAGDVIGPMALVADEQTAGYGRYGRQYYSPQATGLYLTLIWPWTDMKTLAPGKVTTGIAVAAAEALSQEIGVEVGIKWVNDLYYNQRKVAGILVEAVPNTTGEDGFLVIGIGLNINPADYPADIAQKAGALTNQTVNRNRLAATLLNYFVRYFSLDASQVMTAYRQRSLVIGQPVEMAVGNQAITGIAKDVSADGGLVVDVNGQRQTFYSGEITKLTMTGWVIS